VLSPSSPVTNVTGHLGKCNNWVFAPRQIRSSQPRKSPVARCTIPHRPSAEGERRKGNQGRGQRGGLRQGCRGQRKKCYAGDNGVSRPSNEAGGDAGLDRGGVTSCRTASIVGKIPKKKKRIRTCGNVVALINNKTTLIRDLVTYRSLDTEKFQNKGNTYSARDTYFINARANKMTGATRGTGTAGGEGL